MRGGAARRCPPEPDVSPPARSLPPGGSRAKLLAVSPRQYDQTIPAQADSCQTGLQFQERIFVASTSPFSPKESMGKGKQRNCKQFQGLSQSSSAFLHQTVLLLGSRNPLQPPPPPPHFLALSAFSPP